MADILIVIGIGGSYLGAYSAIELLSGGMGHDGPEVLFAGNNMSPGYIMNLLKRCEGKRVALNVISKSGTTTEPAVAFRIFRAWMEERYGADSSSRIFITTDRSRGVLKKIADEKGYETFVVPDDIGGRYSVLTPVGLLPIAAAGFSIEEIMEGAALAMKELAGSAGSAACRYAALRNVFYNKGKTTEVLVTSEPHFIAFAEWFKQLFGESEGKDEKGIFPASVSFTTDLHSLGQYIQNGRRNLFETVLRVAAPSAALVIPTDPTDGLAFLDGKEVGYVNGCALRAAIIAHEDGGVPVLELVLPELTPFWYGYMVYFFETACALSGYMLKVNPFNQPGVESYKINMFALLGKPGFEEQGEKLAARL